MVTIETETMYAERHATSPHQVPFSAPWTTRFHVVALLLVLPLVAMAVGCEPPPPPNGQLHIENVAKWYSLFRADNRGRPPKDEDEFFAFIDAKQKERGSELVDRTTFLTSERDGKKYVVQYGKPHSFNPEQNVAVCEAEGYKGKKLIAFELGHSEEVDEQRLQSLLAQP